MKGHRVPVPAMQATTNLRDWPISVGMFIVVVACGRDIHVSDRVTGARAVASPSRTPMSWVSDAGDLSLIHI